MILAASQDLTGTSSWAVDNPRPSRLALPVLILIVTFTLPPETSVSLGSLRLSPYRVVLLLTILPNLIHLMSSRDNPVNGADIAIFLHAIWVVIALGASGGIEQAIESGGIYFIECIGAYAMGRRYIRCIADFSALSVALAVTVCCLAVIAVPESVSHTHFPREAFRSALGGPALPVIEPRLGLSRAFGTFEHPILFGVFSSMAFSTTYFVARRAFPGIRGWIMVSGVVVASFVSLSAGPWLMLGIQCGLVAWEAITRNIPGRWLALSMLFVCAISAVSLLSNRSPVKVFISYASFSAQSSYNRILIWDYGTAEVARHPLLGIGFGDWVRAPWMSASMDNFWLVVAVRFGLPGLGFLVLCILLIVYGAARQADGGRQWEDSRFSWMVTLAGTAFAACTVHLWNNTFGFFLFFLGSGVWLMKPASPWLDADTDQVQSGDPLEDGVPYATA